MWKMCWILNTFENVHPEIHPRVPLFWFLNMSLIVSGGVLWVIELHRHIEGQRGAIPPPKLPKIHLKNCTTFLYFLPKPSFGRFRRLESPSTSRGEPLRKIRGNAYAERTIRPACIGSRFSFYGSVVVGRRTSDRKIASSTPGRCMAGQSRSTQPSIPPG